MERITINRQKVDQEKAIPIGMRWGICTRCKQPYLTYFKHNTICDVGKCFEIGKELARGYKE